MSSSVVFVSSFVNIGQLSEKDGRTDKIQIGDTHACKHARRRAHRLHDDVNNSTSILPG